MSVTVVPATPERFWIVLRPPFEMLSVAPATERLTLLLAIVPSVPSSSVPAETVVVPLWVLAPVKVSVPEPTLVRPPPVPVIEPAKVVEPLSPPTVRVLPPSATVVPDTPVRLRIVWLPAAAMSNVAPDAVRLTPLLCAIEPPGPRASVPAAIVVAPV